MHETKQNPVHVGAPTATAASSVSADVIRTLVFYLLAFLFPQTSSQLFSQLLFFFFLWIGHLPFAFIAGIIRLIGCRGIVRRLEEGDGNV